LKDGQYYIEEGKLFDTLEQAERELFNKITKELHED